MAVDINGIGQNSFTINNTDIGRLYVDGTLVWQKGFKLIIEYLMTQPLIDGGNNFWYTEDTSDDETDDDGKFSEGMGSYCHPTEAEYPQDGTTDLSMYNRIVETTTSFTGESLFLNAYDVIIGISWLLVGIHNHGDGTADVYRGDKDTPLTLAPKDIGLIYNKDSYYLQNDFNFPIIPFCASIPVNNMNSTDIQKISLIFNTSVSDFWLEDLIYDGNYGTLQNFLHVGGIVVDGVTSYLVTVDYQPKDQVVGTDLTIAINGSTDNYRDFYANLSDTDTVSNTFDVDTTGLNPESIYISLDDLAHTHTISPPTGVTLNRLTDHTITTAQALVTSSNTSCSVTYRAHQENLIFDGNIGVDTGDNSGVITDAQMETNIYFGPNNPVSPSEFSIEGLDASHVYTIETTGCTSNDTYVNRYMELKVNDVINKTIHDEDYLITSDVEGYTNTDGKDGYRVESITGVTSILLIYTATDGTATDQHSLFGGITIHDITGQFPRSL